MTHKELEDKAEKVQQDYDLYGLLKGMAYCHRKNPDGTRKEVMNISNSCSYTGQALYAASLRLRLAVINNDEQEQEKANAKIANIVAAFCRMQNHLGDGQLARYFYMNGPYPGMDEQHNHRGTYYYQEMTWDQFIPVFYGFYGLYWARHHLSPSTYNMARDFLQRMGDHFVKNKGFKGSDYYLKAKSHKKYEMIYGQCVLRACYTWTEDFKFFELMQKRQQKNKKTLQKMGDLSTPSTDRWYTQARIKTAYFFKNWKFLPRDIYISQKHLESRVEPHLNFMALIPLADWNHLYVDILDREYEKVESRDHPWFIMNYYSARNKEFKYQEIKDVEYGMVTYIRPYYALITDDNLLSSYQYVTYKGDVITRSETPLDADQYVHGYSWPQSDVFKHRSLDETEEDVYEDHVGYLTSYYLYKLKRKEEV